LKINNTCLNNNLTLDAATAAIATQPWIGSQPLKK